MCIPCSGILAEHQHIDINWMSESHFYWHGQCPLQDRYLRWIKVKIAAESRTILNINYNVLNVMIQLHGNAMISRLHPPAIQIVYIKNEISQNRHRWVLEVAKRYIILP